eukprot:TRINITY_DN3072_c0_g1_i1.p1 TRINITY_DN3072_c0_g1~~TRINITY_DN3072_c0_g1_i1.p1  ORF type:complete len:616 (+),score=101.42 TRINITY_DN3072_c0_g1_i1:58-1905(+)
MTDLTRYDTADLSNAVCLVCGSHSDYWGSWAGCGHSVCWKCALRIRYVRPDQEKSKVCCICQKQSNGLILHADEDAEVTEAGEGYISDTNGWDVHYCNTEIQDRVKHLREPYCPLQSECKDDTLFTSVEELQKHLTSKHRKRLCLVCVEGNSKFLAEQTLYTQNQLRFHEDPNQECHNDDKSFKGGHPFCLFCHKHVYDNEALYTHMMHSHLQCDLCENNKSNPKKLVFYKGKGSLSYHLRNSHIQCKECEYRFTRRGELEGHHPTEWTFLSEVDYLKHMRDVHGDKTVAIEDVVKNQMFTYDTKNSNAPARRNPSSSAAASSSESEPTQPTITFALPNNKFKSVSLGPSLPTVTATRNRKYCNVNEDLESFLIRVAGSDLSKELFDSTKKFLQGNVKPQLYYPILASAISNFNDEIFQELAKAIPDPDLREGLRLVHNMSVLNGGTLSLVDDFPTLGGGKSPVTPSVPGPSTSSAQDEDAPTNSWGKGRPKTLKPEPKKTLSQVLNDTDDFPALGGGTGGGVKKSNWGATRNVADDVEGSRYQPPSHEDVPRKAPPASKKKAPKPSKKVSAPLPAPKTERPPTTANFSVDDFPTLGGGKFVASKPKVKTAWGQS